MNISGYPGYDIYYPSGYIPNGAGYPGYNPGYNPGAGSYPGYYPSGGSPGYNPSGGSPGYNPNGGSPGYNPSENSPEEPEFGDEGGKIPNAVPVDNDVEVFDVPPNKSGGQPGGGYPSYPGAYPGYPGVFYG